MTNVSSGAPPRRRGSGPRPPRPAASAPRRLPDGTGAPWRRIVRSEPTYPRPRIPSRGDGRRPAARPDRRPGRRGLAARDRGGALPHRARHRTRRGQPRGEHAGGRARGKRGGTRRADPQAARRRRPRRRRALHRRRGRDPLRRHPAALRRVVGLRPLLLPLRLGAAALGRAGGPRPLPAAHRCRPRRQRRRRAALGATRTVGLPFGPEPGEAESLGWSDAIATAFEVVAALCCLAVLVRPSRACACTSRRSSSAARPRR